jgi:predicted metal-dependent enzyme (double-stranded beta helix superfamily)
VNATKTIWWVRRRSTKERIRPGDKLTTHGGQRWTFQHVVKGGESIAVHPTGTTHPARPRRLSGFSDVEWMKGAKVAA